jgi:hypothetical protein
MADGTESDTDADTTETPPRTVGVLARLAVAAIAMVLGVFWIVRLAVVGPTVRGGLLFELLPPLVLLYFGVDYVRTQRRALNRGS